MNRALLFLTLLWLAWPAEAAKRLRDFEKAPHNYWEHPPRDRFTQLKAALEGGRIPLDRASEKAFVTSLLKALDISPATQTLVFSTTSLQLRRISPRNPRALYFNEDIYVGWVPGGQLEIVSIDPRLGGIFYIFDIPRESAPVKVERSARCFNCHAEFEIGRVPGLLLKSVVPGNGGGSLESFRNDRTGHGIPFKDRFGGWHLTGRHGIQQHQGNLVGEFVAGVIKTYPNPPAKQFRWETYPVATSDVLAHLLQEHQVGFVNRAVKATYDTRAAIAAGEARAVIQKHSETLTQYLLFAEETPLPAGGAEGAAALKEFFLARARKTTKGASLREFDLRTRMFKYRCSYMIHSAAFTGLPAPLKTAVLKNVRTALLTDHALSAHLPVAEKQAIHRILSATLAPYTAVK